MILSEIVDNRSSQAYTSDGMFRYFHIRWIIRPMRFQLPLAVVFMLMGIGAFAQNPEQPPTLTEDLCACMSAIDVRASDAAVQYDVRFCLEEAVVRHPGETLALLHRRPAQADRAFQLGLMLGGSLDQHCPGYRTVKARLQQMPPSGLLKKQGT